MAISSDAGPSPIVLIAETTYLYSVLGIIELDYILFEWIFSIIKNNLNKIR